MHDSFVTLDTGGFDHVGLSKGAVGVIHAATVPEPASLAIFATATGGMLFRRRLRRSNKLIRDGEK